MTTHDHDSYVETLQSETIERNCEQLSTASSHPDQLTLEFSGDKPEHSEQLLLAPQRLEQVYATWAPTFRRRGYNRVPIRRCPNFCGYSCWYVPMTDVDFEVTLRRFPARGKGLLIDSVFPDGTKLAALDVDSYMSFALAVTEHPRRIRHGVRGLAIFLLPQGQGLSSVEFRVKGEFGQASLEQSEELGTRKIRVTPPTFYPKTRRPDLWSGPALHEISFEELPSFENCPRSEGAVSTQVLDCIKLRRADQNGKHCTQNLRPPGSIDGMKASSSKEGE